MIHARQAAREPYIGASVAEVSQLPQTALQLLSANGWWSDEWSARHAGAAVGARARPTSSAARSLANILGSLIWRPALGGVRQVNDATVGGSREAWAKKWAK